MSGRPGRGRGLGRGPCEPQRRPALAQLGVRASGRTRRGSCSRKSSTGSWRFSPKQVDIQAGSSLVVTNRGGETHTFTQVTQFGGGGIVAELNQILFGTSSPPTFFFGPLNFIPAGQPITVSPETLTPGTHLFFCAIHPWMQETVHVAP
jgi:plastocyanin